MVKEIVKFGDKTYQFIWTHGGEIPQEGVSQVSGYVFNKDKDLLIVKSKNWTIPGGHPEVGEDYLMALKREVMEEAMVEIDNIKYLGKVKVVNLETNEINYQLRFTASAFQVNIFDKKMETSERLSLRPEKLSEYIPWASGKVFSKEVKDAVSSFDNTFSA